MLEGVDLGNGWTVLRHLSLPKSHTGGFFSYGYVVEHKDGREGYLKALDFFDPLYYSEDPAGELLTLTESFVYERELLKRCATGRLSRVVRSLDHGTVRVDGFGEGVVSTVQYLIFELAEGDVRSKLDLMDEMGLAWALRSLHHVANGLRQLHSIKVAPPRSQAVQRSALRRRVILQGRRFRSSQSSRRSSSARRECDRGRSPRLRATGVALTERHRPTGALGGSAVTHTSWGAWWSFSSRVYPQPHY